MNLVCITCLLLTFVFHYTVFCDDVNKNSRLSKRVHIPQLGLGPRCTGCPPHFCDDDPAIIQGYCCGCARFYDKLPVQCSPLITCPLNSYDLCQDYEYMMYCCCG